MAVKRTRARRTVFKEPESYHGLLRPMGGFVMYYSDDVVALIQGIQSK